MIRKTLLAALAIPLFAPACTDSGPDVGPAEVEPTSPFDSGAEFVAIPRRVDDEAAAARRRQLTDAGAPAGAVARAAGSTDFYLAIRKNTLSNRYFLSAFLEQYFPGAVGSGAAQSLGTRVVSFKVQNDKLFVFDVDDRATTSDVFDPQRLVEAFPIVNDPLLRLLPGSSQYVIIDPAAGLNQFDVVSDAFAWSGYPIRFSTELSFLQQFTQLSDGISYERVFTGYADQPIGDGVLDPNVFRASGTLSFALRRYKEGAHFQEVAMPAQEHYFRGDPRLIPNTGAVEQLAAHWDIYPGMQPIPWLIAPELAALDSTPAYADVDLVGAVKAGVETWNDAFGFPVFTARVGTAAESFSRDDLNYIIFDPDPSLGYAYANWRTNPNTGEIRGATVYFGAGWVDRTGFDDDVADVPPADGHPAAIVPAPVHRTQPSLRWAGTANAPLCVQWAHDHAGKLAGAGDDSQLTGAEKLEAFVAHMIAHEVGHDLGLRHNFKGSLVPPSSSVMEYSEFSDWLAQGDAVGSYDVAAVRYLYGLSPDLPVEPFCTDDRAGIDPDCRRFDYGADPLGETWAYYFSIVRDWFTQEAVSEDYADVVDQYAFWIWDYAQQGDDGQANRAVDFLFDGIAAPIDPAALEANPLLGPGADLVMRRTLLALAPSPNPATAGRIESQLQAVMRNDDGVRSLTTRRVLVDILKSRQNLESYRTLLQARGAVEAELAAGLDADQELRAYDLLARIDRAVTPYFD